MNHSFYFCRWQNTGAKGIRNCYHEWQSIWPIYYSGGLAYTKYSVNFDVLREHWSWSWVKNDMFVGRVCLKLLLSGVCLIKNYPLCFSFQNRKRDTFLIITSNYPKRGVNFFFLFFFLFSRGSVKHRMKAITGNRELKGRKIKRREYHPIRFVLQFVLTV